MPLAPGASFGQSPAVRRVGLSLVMLTLPLVASAAPASDPAFLGIGMDDAPGYCSVNSVTPSSPAQDAGLEFGDAVMAIDGVHLGAHAAASVVAATPCTTLASLIVARRPGDDVTLLVRRGARKLSVQATLSTRGEVMFRLFVGQHLPRTELVDIDRDDVTYEVGGVQGRTTVVGWFQLQRCAGCDRVFDQVADGLRARFKARDSAPLVLAAAPVDGADQRARLRASFSAGVPLAVVDPDVFDTLALKDPQRVSFMVIDGRGIVRHVAPIAPDSEDLAAAIDDILAAAEQVEHARTRRP